MAEVLLPSSPCVSVSLAEPAEAEAAQPPPPPPPPSASPRRPRRRSDRHNLPADGVLAPNSAAENSPLPLSVGRKRPTPREVTRFGFKKRALPKEAGASSDDGASAAGAPGAPVMLSALVDEVLGDLNEQLPLLRTKLTASRHEFKAQIVELTDLVKQLKAALAAQLKKGKALAEAVAPLQEEMNGRLHALDVEATKQRQLAERGEAEGRALSQRVEERGKRLAEMRDAAAKAADELAATTKAAADEAARADSTEAQLCEVEAGLAAARAELEELRTKSAEAAEAAEAAATAARDAAECAAREAAEAAEAHGTAAREAAGREAELSKERDAEAAAKREHEASLEALRAEKTSLDEAHAALTREHNSLSESAAAQGARLQSAEERLAEKTAMLAQKDADLRDSMSTVASMQNDHTAALAREQARAQALDEEARALRAQLAESVAAHTEAKHEAETTAAELSGVKQELAEDRAALAAATEAKDRLTIESAERGERLTAKTAEVASLEAGLAKSQEALAGASGALRAEEAKSEGFQTRLHELEVEYRSYQEHHGSSNAQQMAAISELQVTVDRLSSQVRLC